MKIAAATYNKIRKSGEPPVSKNFEAGSTGSPTSNVYKKPKSAQDWLEMYYKL
jgi:hypothetical protein